MAASGSHNQRMNLTSIFTTLLYTWHKVNLHITFARRLGGLLHVICLFSLRPVFRGMRNEINAVLLLSDSYHFFYYSHDRLDIYIKQGAVWNISIFFVILLPISGLIFLCSKPFTDYFYCYFPFCYLICWLNIVFSGFRNRKLQWNRLWPLGVSMFINLN